MQDSFLVASLAKNPPELRKNPPPTFVSLRAVVALLIPAVSTVSCAQGEALGEIYDTDAELGSEGVIVNDGFMWCTRATGAVLIVPNIPDPLVEDPDDDDKAPKGCFCASPEEHAALDLLDNDNDWSVAVSDSQPDDLTTLRTAIQINAAAHCNDVADEQGGGLYSNTCNDVLDDADPLFPEESPPGEPNCAAPERIGSDPGMEDPPVDSYSDYYSLSSAIVYNSGQAKYYIDVAFFHDMLDNPGWLLDDAARIVEYAGTPPYRFDIPGTSGVAYKLGIRNNDRPVSINGYSLSGGMLDALDAYSALANSTTFTFVVKRGSSNTTLQYVVQ